MKKQELIKILNDFKQSGEVTLKDYRIFSVYVFDKQTNKGGHLILDFALNLLNISEFRANKEENYYKELSNNLYRLTHKQAVFARQWLEETFFKI